MKLFTDTVTQYIAAQVDRSLHTPAGEGGNELRIFTQSMPPAAVHKIFSGVAEHLDSKVARVRCEMRVAHGLYSHWRGRPGLSISELERIEQRGWIDTDDRLTHYRNLTVGIGEDLLLVVLVGIDHATDRGGLADFHTLTEEAIFRDCMGANYQQWVAEALSAAGLADTAQTGVREFENFLRQLFQLRPRNLIALSDFLTEVLLPKADSCDSASDFLALAFDNLPFWGLPPLLSPTDPSKRTTRLPVLAKIYGRDSYREARERRKALAQIEAARERLGAPPEARGQHGYADVDDFLATLIDFVEQGSTASRERLLQTDFSVVIDILEARLSRRPKKSAPTRLQGPGLQVFLQAVFTSLQEFTARCGRSWPPSQLQQIDIALESFEFDGAEDDIDDGQATAEDVFRGLVGGLDNFLGDFSLTLRAESTDDDAAPLVVPIQLMFGYLDREVEMNTRRLKESRLRFRVCVLAKTGALTVERSFMWVLPPHHEERVRLACARRIEAELSNPAMRLPVMELGQTLDELYFALDESEAHRLLASGLTHATFRDALDGLQAAELGDLNTDLAELSATYRAFVRALSEQGYYVAIEAPLRALVRSYRGTVDLALRRDAERQAYGDELLRRLYQAFMAVPEGTPAASAYVPALLATGITPAIAETVQAREVFLRNGFTQVACTLLEDGSRKGKAAFARLLGLVELRRPLYGLVFDTSRRLTTSLRSFGLIHRLGERPAVAPTLSSQAEMRSDDGNDTVSLTAYLRVSPESRVITRTLADYRQVHSYAVDRLSVLAVNVEDLRPVLAGIDTFLLQELTSQDQSIEVPYYLNVQIIGRGPAATAAQEVLRLWQERWVEDEVRRQRRCRLSVSYRPARSRREVLELLKQVDKKHDVGFLFDFLNDQSGGDSIVPARRFEIDWGAGNIGKFPVCEHPRPPRPADPHLRQGLVSNRRFQVAARHAEITARLKTPDHPGEHHLIFNQVEYGEPERNLTRRMHELSRWVACVDRFVDKSLILDMDTSTVEQRKLVGFTSGVGAYGELNLTLSTESNTAGELLKGTARRLGQIYCEWSANDCQQAAQCLVGEAQAVTGLSLVRALGDEGVMRDVIGYAIANRLYLGTSRATMCAAIPLDSFAHWFDGADVGLIPDLLLIEADLRGEYFSIDATIVECKVGKRSPYHVEEAVMQAAAGLTHLSELFVPNSESERASAFDRRYWWAQLHRALVVRNVRAISPHEADALDCALERLTEGDFDIHWRGVGATFWTDAGADDEELTLRLVKRVGPLLDAHDTVLEVYHVAVGQGAVRTALQHVEPSLREWIWPEQAASVRVDRTESEDGPWRVESTLTPSDSGGADESAPTMAAVDPVPAVPPNVLTPSNAASIVAGSDLGVEVNAAPSRSVPERILLGSELSVRGGLGAPVYWEYDHAQLPNRHLLVFGGSGAGKTYTIQALLLEMAQARQSSLVIDYTDGFLPKQLEPELRERIMLENFVLATGKKLPLDPFRPQHDEIEGIGVIREHPFDVAKRVSSIFTAVYSTLGEQQRATLINKIEQGVTASSFSLQLLYEQLRDEGEDLLANKIMPLARTDPFITTSEDAWAQLFAGQRSKLSILQLARVPTEVQRLIIEFVLWDLWDYLRRSGSKDQPRPVVLDEVQNLDHRSGSPLEKYLREGRKFGASMILATQTMSNFRNDERDRLFQAAHMLFFAPAPTELRSFAAILKDREPGSSADDWARRLSALKKGECLSVGYERRPDGSLRTQIRHVAVTPLADRIGGM